MAACLISHMAYDECHKELGSLRDFRVLVNLPQWDVPPHLP